MPARCGAWSSARTLRRRGPGHRSSREEARMDRVADQRSIGDLLSELSRETATLVRQEVALARTELTRSVARIQRHAVLIVAGGALAYAGMLSLVAALVLALVRFG